VLTTLDQCFIVRAGRGRLPAVLGWGAIALGAGVVAVLVVLGLSFAAHGPSLATCSGGSACAARLAGRASAGVATPVLSVGGVLLGVVGAGGLVVVTRLRRRSPRRPRS
jgi:hypothetical protein